MPKFQYKATNMDGRTMEGIFEANDRRAVVEMLRGKAFFPLSISEVSSAGSLNRELGSKIPLKALALFCQQFATILSSGIAVGQALDILAQQTENKRLKSVLLDVYEKVLTGHSLTAAFSDHAFRFPPIFMSMISVGELSGSLEISLNRLHTYFKQENSIVTKFRTAMVYPAIVSVLAVGIVTFLLIFIVPKFKSIFDNFGQALPLPTQILLSISDAMQHNYVIIIIAVVALILIFRMFSKSEKGKLQLDKLKLAIPTFGVLNKKLLVSRFTRTLSTMTAAGVPLTQALDITSRVVTNKYIENKLTKASESLQQGIPLYKPLAEIKEFPNMVVQMTRLGEESGTLDYMLEQTAVYYDEETEVAIARLMATIEPVVIFVLGGIVLFIVLSILLPTFQMSNLVAGTMK